jgi:hypothetical protein
MDLIKYDDVEKIHHNGSSKEVGAECGSDDEGYRKYERREEVKERFVNLNLVNTARLSVNEFIAFTS